MLAFINFIILFGVIQGLLLSLVLLFSKKNEKKPKIFLALLLWVVVYNGLETLNWSAGWNLQIFGIFNFTFIFGIGPSLYLFIRSRLGLDLGKDVWRHYLPVFLQFLFRGGLYIYFIATRDYPLSHAFNSWNSFLAEPLTVIWAGYYWYLSDQLLRNFSSDELSKSEDAQILSIKIAWVRQLVFFIKIILWIWIFTVILIYTVPEVPGFSWYYPSEMGLVIFIYWISLTGFQQYYFLSREQSSGISPLLREIPEVERAQLASRLKQLMQEEQLYLDPELKVQSLAQKLELKPKVLSLLLNQHLQTGFNDYVNAFRVEEVKKRLLSKEKTHLTISGIALEAGFNSQATFQRVFKKMEGIRPSEYLALHQQNDASNPK